MVSLEEFTYNKTGPRAGTPLSRCKYCRSAGNPSTVAAEDFMPIVEKLFKDRTLKEVSELTKLDKQLLSIIQRGKRKRINKKTYFNLFRAASQLPKNKVSIGPQKIVKNGNGLHKLDYEGRLALRQLISEAQKDRYKKDKQLLKHVV